MRLSELTKPEIDAIVGNANFTEEEYQVFQYLCKGTALDEMVFKLKLSKATISRIVFKVKTKIERIDKMKQNVPVWEKITMTVEEAADWAYFMTVTNRFCTGQNILIDGLEAGNAHFVWPEE